MKRLIAAGALLAFITVACIVGVTTVKVCSDELDHLLNSAQGAAVRGDMALAKELAQKAEDTYIESERRLSLFIDHLLVENLGEELARLPDLARDETPAEFLSQLKAAQVIMTHIERDNSPTLRNIF